MIDRSKTAAALWALITATTFATATPAVSQVTDAQRSAIRAQCRSDYEAHCASVPPGGAAALQCLQKNMSSLAPGCQSAVHAVEAAAEPKADTKTEPKTESAPAEPAAKPAAEAPTATAAKTTERTTETASDKAAASAPAKKPSSAQVAAIRSACRSDYQRTCAGVPTGGAAALNCLEKNKSKLSASCQQAVNAAGGGAATSAAGDTAPAAAATAGPDAAPAAAPLVLRPMRPREVLFVLRSACGGDVRALCPGVEPGGGRIAHCLAEQAASLSPACRDVLAPFAAR
ncbi:cysteine rich repeat-containing protein [Bradyrhizobium canariense]|uniref:Cysteine rich repeat-containing protein n=1 Tax=Bradyrhizobium canariense TaxID=255045 RepID=A0A1H1ZQJ0_9BRAD|nr:cysteine rich repeat-containing protein [Bradyrhizobium canariense]SDT35516.1 Cysteine rich repeat-containing protein [Bradyrhizobium canariense]